MPLPSASAAHAVISEMTKPAPSDAAMRRNGASVIPDIGASSTGLGRETRPTETRCISNGPMIARAAVWWRDACISIVLKENEQIPDRRLTRGVTTTKEYHLTKI